VTGTDGGVTIDPDPETEDNGNSLSWMIALALAIGLLVVAPVLIILGLKAGRRSRRRSQADPAEAISGAWSEAVDDLSDRRVTWPASATPLEVADRVPALVGAATQEPLRALADAYGSVRYGTRHPPHGAADQAWQQVAALRAALDGSSTFLRRLRARLDPTTLRSQSPRYVRRESSAQPEPAGWSKPRSPSTKD
jgi:hypothetical protein